MTRVRDESRPSWWRRRRPDTRTAVWLFLLLFGFYALWAGGHTYSSDEEGAYQQARALMHGTYALEISPENAPITALRSGRDGLPAAVGGIGQSAAGVPLLALGRLVSTAAPTEQQDVVERLFTGFTNSWITALIVVLIFLIAREVGAGRRSAVLLALVYGVGTMAWPHAKTLLFSEPLAALLICAGVLYAIRTTTRGTMPWALLSGLAISASMLARISTAPFLIIVAAYVLAIPLIRAGIKTKAAWRQMVPRTLLLGIGLAIPVVLLLAVNAWRYGSASDTGYGAVPLDFSPVEGLYGLILSPGKGLLWYAPVLLVAIVALPFAFRRKPAEVSLFLLIILANLAIFARFFQWHGEQAWGPRYMQTVLPMVVLIVAPVLVPGCARWWRRGLVIAGGIGAIVGFLGSVIYFNAYFAFAGQRLGTQTVDQEPALWRPIHFSPKWSPIVGHARLLNDAVVGTAGRIDGTDVTFGQTGVFPTADAARYSWYFWPPQLDTWWYWLLPEKAPLWPLALFPVFVVAAGTGLRGLRKESASI